MMPVDRPGLLVLLTFLLLPASPVLAQPSPSWQGSRPQQHTTPVPSAQEPRPPAIPQPSLPPSTQNDGEAHPQVMETPAAQTLPASPFQLDLSTQQPAAGAHATTRPAKPAYLGAAGQTVQSCRYPAGVRITRVIEGSPAQHAGLRGEGTLSWQEAMTGVLAMTPLAPLVLPFVTESEHGGSGDLILAVDGKRIHNREELEQEMKGFRPGDTVYFSVLREENGVHQIAVQLAEYSDTSPTATAK